MNSADQLIQASGQRATPVRSAVLGILMETDAALSHAEILDRLQALGEFDRVTVYRVLDWLVEHGLLHKVAGAGRAWRFRLTRNETMHRHAHFQCNQCGRIFCLPDVQPVLPKKVPASFSVESIELNLKGICDDCSRVAAE
ncbi:Fur family transcriptional regulator [Methylobacillus sp. MM3]|jgi:Fur family transcriptional regulator, ferric uptake regulator|uniref:Fur family transcriptional regulator n=1 Tax=Methylobacillus sp. MM3 TaxID=1848039 RepID=UPI0007DF1B3D|nr:Fur family transcriptional regulator [Methylobacillus sp. MM3]OAJ69348.1 Fur family transcriptional regulator [Methylobacillus sp. MM3]